MLAVCGMATAPPCEQRTERLEQLLDVVHQDVRPVRRRPRRPVRVTIASHVHGDHPATFRQHTHWRHQIQILILSLLQLWSRSNIEIKYWIGKDHTLIIFSSYKSKVLPEILGKLLQLMLPGEPELGEAVEEQHQGPAGVAIVHVVQLDALQRDATGGLTTDRRCAAGAFVEQSPISLTTQAT